jgi:hypothetical protein
MLKPICTALAIAALCLPTGAVAQSSDVPMGQSIEGGVKGGVSLATIPNFADVLAEEAGASADYRVGAVIGGFLAFPLARAFSLQPEVLFTQRGLEGDIPAIAESFKLKLSYIDVPVLVRIGPASGRGFHVLAGPSFNFNVGAQLIIGGTFNDEQDFKDEVEDVDVGLVVGAGYYGPYLIVEGRYEEGLTNTSTLSDDENYRNRGFIALVGIRFGRSAARPAP